jgi:hypothetical protein
MTAALAAEQLGDPRDTFNLLGVARQKTAVGALHVVLEADTHVTTQRERCRSNRRLGRSEGTNAPVTLFSPDVEKTLDHCRMGGRAITVAADHKQYRRTRERDNSSVNQVTKAYGVAGAVKDESRQHARAGDPSEEFARGRLSVGGRDKLAHGERRGLQQALSNNRHLLGRRVPTDRLGSKLDYHSLAHCPRIASIAGR